MRFAWKVGMSIVLVAVLLFSAGGGLLIQSQFSASLQREKEAAQEENSLLAMALYRQLDAGRLPGAGAEDAGAQREIGLPAGGEGDPGAARRELAPPQHRRHGRLPVRHQLEAPFGGPVGHDLEVVRHRLLVEHQQRGGEIAERRVERGDGAAEEAGGEGLVLGAHGALGGAVACGGGDGLGHR